MSDLKKIKDEFLLKLKGKLDISEINKIKSDLFGKSGLISTQFKKIGTIAESERKKFASDLNIIKDELQDLISSKIILRVPECQDGGSGGSASSFSLRCNHTPLAILHLQRWIIAISRCSCVSYGLLVVAR